MIMNWMAVTQLSLTLMVNSHFMDSPFQILTWPSLEDVMNFMF